MRSFSFVSERHIIICALFLIDDNEIEPQLVILDFTKQGTSSCYIDEISDARFLCFPALEETVALTYFTIRSDPCPAWKAHPNLNVPFETSRENRLYVISLAGYYTRHRITLFVLLSSLRPYLDSPLKCVPWDHWGSSEKTRILGYPVKQSKVKHLTSSCRQANMVSLYSRSGYAMLTA